MPFTQVQAMPNKPPTVRIFLTGQLMLQPSAESDSCEVFVNRSAPNHHLTIEVREKRDDRPDAILMRHYGPLAFLDMDAPIEGMLIRRNPAGSVSMYTGKPGKYGEALTSAIDLRSEGFHPSNELRIDSASTRPSIMIQHGIFHTAATTSEKLKMKLSRGKEQRELPSFTTLIGANIYLEDGESLTMSWVDMGITKTLELKTEDGLTFEIYIINDPLFESPEAAKTHDEFGEYYKVLPTVSTNERLKLDVQFPDPVTAASAKGTTKTPCMPVIISGP